MTGKYAQVVDTNWDDRVLFPESVPHLFHFDLLYLWMLEKEPDRRPRTWRERIEGWRYLAALFLLGELYAEEEPIREPFVAYTRPFGIESVAWLVTRSDEKLERLGVLSPTVLVRPLPDFTAEALSHWKKRFGDLTKRADEIRHFIDLAVGRLLDGESQSVPSFRARLAAVLEREFGRQAMAISPAGRDVTVPVLRSIGWAKPRLEAEAPVQVNLLVRESGGLRARVYVPRCTVCNELLTRTSEQEPVEVRGPGFQLICPRGHVNNLSLADFLIWYRGKGQVVAWRDDRQVPLDRGAPPLRTIRGIQIDMEWNTGNVAGDRRRFLRLSFPEMTVREHRLEEILFDKLLVPGALHEFKGLPIRLEWIDALQNPELIVPEVDTGAPRVIYRNLQLGGWPVPVARPLGGLSLQVREDLAVGVYPNPEKVGSGWNWFRAFVDGPGRREHRLRCDRGIPVLPWVVETTNGKLGFITLESASDPKIGATFYAEPANRTDSVSGLPEATAHVGLDFGTSNTLVAFHQIEHGGGLGQIQTLLPEQLLEIVAWLAPPVLNEWEGATGDFLPPRNYRKSADDRHIIPSALWMLQDRQVQYFIRWDGREPVPRSQPISGFKWDPPGGSLGRERLAYLQEVLLLTFPSLLAQTVQSQRVVAIELGLAFPLAFDNEARTGMRSLLDRLQQDLLRLTGLSLQFAHLNESAACVNAFGTFRHGETFLVADMGGGTIDVALFTASLKGGRELHQIGSLRLAGEDGIRALAIRKGSRSAGDEVAWRLRDVIAQGRAKEIFGKDSDAQSIAQRLTVFAFELLRIMVIAHRKLHGLQGIRIVLVGNGWHLADAFSDRARQRGARAFFKEFYSQYIRQLGEPDLELYEGEPLGSVPTSKHLVVRGALENTLESHKQELDDDDVRLSRLPAGRTMIFEPPQRSVVQLGWEHILGQDEEVALHGVAPSDLRPEFLRFEQREIPELKESWKLTLLDAFDARQEADIPCPDEPQLRRSVGRSIEGHRIGRGPLQVILEECWREELSR
jgi:hypothetical protein